MKRFILIFLFILLCVPVNAQIITGEVEYSTEATEQLSYEDLKNRFYDSNNIENLNYLFQGITELKDRKLAKFSDGSYAVHYYDNPFYSFYYSQNGKLISYTYKSSQNYPCNFKKFKPDGSIINTGTRVSEKESFIYSVDGKLLAHWLGDKCFDKNNNLIMTRKIRE